jgi:hypothetical protein
MLIVVIRRLRSRLRLPTAARTTATTTPTKATATPANWMSSMSESTDPRMDVPSSHADASTLVPPHQVGGSIRWVTDPVMTGEETTFRTEGPTLVPPRRMKALHLSLEGPPLKGVFASGPGIRFETVGWYEVLLAVEWDPHDREGTRFSHTRIPGQEPLHSEAIEAAVLVQLSGGRQLLRGNTVFGLDHTRQIVLEVWHDSPRPVEVRAGELRVRELGK